jgi:hypothetical protein
MAIKSNVGIPLVAIAVTDTTVLNPVAPVERIAVTACVLHNTNAASRTVTLWESPNLTSASGTEIAVYSIGPDQSVDVEEIIGQGYAVGRNIIAQASGVGVNVVSTVTQYDGGS